ncbi:hypothetical protein OO006_11475 [Prosthecochloris sp. SCSIO W1101]|uniref:hypothetical protein n=1 Tax=Prosthecochloris sp. SCSIO W1101 TaxID=2992242 RepID=UPI00223DAFC6|nr:hypothetical protein [Prosthecochloris sp. SCSIO W1101]UZJ40962.1 hypothetical protein OO006_11475 [Prosthecochloris sp. SCSIO W1101]
MKKKNSAVLIEAGSATAAEGPNVGKVGIGPQVINMWTDYADPFSGAGLSVRWWATNEFGVEGNVYYGTTDEDFPDGMEYTSDTILGTLKLMYAPVVNENSRFYVGLESGLGSSSWGEDGSEVDSDDFYLIQPLIGTEFNFSEFTEVGFNFDVGYRFTGEDDGDDSDYEYDLRGVAVGFGAHYYF